MNGVAGLKMRGPRFSVRQQVWLFSILGVVVLLVLGFVIYREIEKRSVLKTHSQLMALLVDGKNEDIGPSAAPVASPMVIGLYMMWPTIRPSTVATRESSAAPLERSASTMLPFLFLTESPPVHFANR
jgi:hypothetical protein